MEDPPSPGASSRLPPFSLLEFGDLVSAALDSPDPSLSFSSAALFTSTLERKASSQSLQCTTTSRVLLLLTRLKKRAAALVKRPRLRVRHSKPLLLPRVCVSSPSVNSTVMDARRRSPRVEFAPHLPLVVQYERSSPYAILTSPTDRTLPSSPTSTSYSHTPPSPTASSFSSECSSADTHFRAPPQYTLHRPWSVVTIEADELSDDPFAKGDVRIVHHSCEVLPSPRRPLRRRRHYHHHRPATPRNAQDWTLSLPDTPSSSDCPSASTCAPTPTPPPAQSTSAEGALPRLGRSLSLAHPRPYAHAPRLPRASSPFPLTLRRSNTARAPPPPSTYYTPRNSAAALPS
ncbi:hypothetical protein B0H15DRAFT_942386 [Mycena belliarum]|uniref:Uncharacterized protein n=1 Tax=Mycena belliarum TaxID=1033014 RepID=A0AAD6UIV8_9AGAR|nr:hypothetical protein B0H15DRAFT_942386 [Mycena belliae]